MEEKLSLFEAKVILLEKSISELVIKLDTFMCMEEDKNIDNVTEVVIEREPSLKQSESSPIAQFDGNGTVNEEITSMAEADGIDVDKSANVVETPQDLYGVWNRTRTKIKIKPGQKSIWIGPRKTS